MVRCLLKLKADVNQGCKEHGLTPLMAAAATEKGDVVRWLVKAGADTQASAWGVQEGSDSSCTAADISRSANAFSEQTLYLEAKTHCSRPGCSGAGLNKCTGCRKARYCGQECQLAHWKAHKSDCKRWSVEQSSGESDI